MSIKFQIHPTTLKKMTLHMPKKGTLCSNLTVQCIPFLQNISSISNQTLNCFHSSYMQASMATSLFYLHDAVFKRQEPKICRGSIPAAATPKLEGGNVSNAKSKGRTRPIGAAGAWFISMGHSLFSSEEKSWQKCLAMCSKLYQGKELIIWRRKRKSLSASLCL